MEFVTLRLILNVDVTRNSKYNVKRNSLNAPMLRPWAKPLARAGGAGANAAGARRGAGGAAQGPRGRHPRPYMPAPPYGYQLTATRLRATPRNTDALGIIDRRPAHGTRTHPRSPGRLGHPRKTATSYKHAWFSDSLTGSPFFSLFRAHLSVTHHFRDSLRSRGNGDSRLMTARSPLMTPISPTLREAFRVPPSSNRLLS